MTTPTYPQLYKLLGNSYADLASLPPQTVAVIEADLSDCVQQLAEANEAIDAREQWLNQAERDLAEADAIIDDLRYELYDARLEAQS